MDTQLLQQTLREETKRLLYTPGLQRLHDQLVTPDQFRAFAIQRHALTMHFISLLRRIIDIADKTNATHLARTTKENLADELGRGKYHTAPHHGSHAQWRANYMHALGVNMSMLTDDMLLPGTRTYNAFLEECLRHGSLSTLLGIFLFLEWSIPNEFRILKHCRDAIMPEQFVPRSTDSPETKRQKGMARMYLDHHITHDENAHFPNLLRAISMETEKVHEQEMLRSIRDTAAARLAFYRSVHEHIFSL